MFFVLKISKLCNLRCTYCYEYDDLGKKARMSLDDLAFFFRGVAAHYLAAGWTTRLHFVLHGGEPALLPFDYLRRFTALQHTYLRANGISYRTSLQSNLTRINRPFVDLLEELDISLGASIDIFGGQRLTLAGDDSQELVLENLQKLFDMDAVRRLSMGAISVLHGGNVSAAVSTFRFFHELGMSYRILPVFSLADPVPRMRHLTLTAPQVVSALQKVARAHTRAGANIEIHPLKDFFEAAVHHVLGTEGRRYDPATMEWALIVDTNGDAYNHSEAYSPDGPMGNIFRQPLTDILSSERRARTLAMRAERAGTCESCRYGRCCNRIPIVEALPSERRYDASDALECLIARPMIEFMVRRITRNAGAMAVIRHEKADLVRATNPGSLPPRASPAASATPASRARTLPAG